MSGGQAVGNYVEARADGRRDAGQPQARHRAEGWRDQLHARLAGTYGARLGLPDGTGKAWKVGRLPAQWSSERVDRSAALACHPSLSRRVIIPGQATNLAIPSPP